MNNIDENKSLVENSKIEVIFERLSKERSNPEIELNYSTPFTLLVAVILSAQSTDKGVNKITTQLFAQADSPSKMLELGEEKLKSYIKSIGLYNSKAKNIIAMSKVLIEQFNETIPNNLEDLEKLPGVGRKSANVILNCIFNQPTIAVDTHVFRVSNRIGLCVSKTTLATEKRLTSVIPLMWRYKAHHWLVLHGRYICKARKPLCKICPIEDICLYKAKSYGS